MSSLNASRPAHDRKPATRSLRLRRGLVTIGLLVALPGAVTTSSASAYPAALKPCEWKGGDIDSGTFRTTDKKRYQCLDGTWYPARSIE